jgi:hypothetical protein
MALSGHGRVRCTRLLLGVKRTWCLRRTCLLLTEADMACAPHTSASYPKRPRILIQRKVASAKTDQY